MERDERKDDFFKKMFQDPHTRQMNQPKCFEKIRLGRIIAPFFFEGSESDRFFNYLHDSNSIFRAGTLNSENVSARTVCGKASSQ